MNYLWAAKQARERLNCSKCGWEKEIIFFLVKICSLKSRRLCLFLFAEFLIFFQNRNSAKWVEQCGQIGWFIALWATFQSLMQQLFCPNRPHFLATFVKLLKYFIFKWNHFRATFTDIGQLFNWSHWAWRVKINTFWSQLSNERKSNSKAKSEEGIGRGFGFWYSW